MFKSKSKSVYGNQEAQPGHQRHEIRREIKATKVLKLNYSSVILYNQM